MIIERMPDKIDALVISDTFSDSEYGDIFDEVRVLCKRDGGSGVWINDMYKDLESSVTHKAVINTFFTDEIGAALSEIHPLLGLYRNVNMHSTLINSYGQSQSTGLRDDSAAFVIKTFLFDEPRGFIGGDITLQVDSDTAYEKDTKNNMTVIFPASYYHSLSEVSIDSADSSGIYVITNYLFIVG